MDLGTGVITFNDANLQMSAKLELDGAAFFEGNRIAEVHLSETDLASYAGKYKSAELGATYVLSVKDGKLFLRSGWQPELALTPSAKMSSRITASEPLCSAETEAIVRTVLASTMGMCVT
jgi:hypothetical protein